MVVVEMMVHNGWGSKGSLLIEVKHIDGYTHFGMARHSNMCVSWIFLDAKKNNSDQTCTFLIIWTDEIEYHWIICMHGSIRCSYHPFYERTIFPMFSFFNTCKKTIRVDHEKQIEQWELNSFDQNGPMDRYIRSTVLIYLSFWNRFRYWSRITSGKVT